MPQKIVGNSALLDTFAAGGTRAIPTESGIDKFDVGFLEGEYPPAEWHNHLFYYLGASLNHVLQNGVPRWNSGTTYANGNMVNEASKIYISQVDDNLNIPPTDTSPEWKPLLAKGDAVPLTREVVAGLGLVDGGSLDVDRTINMGTPGTITLATSNVATGITGAAGTHTHLLSIPDATIGVRGLVTLVSSNQNASEFLAPTANALKVTNDALQAHRIGTDHDTRYYTKSLTYSQVELDGFFAQYLQTTAIQATYKEKNLNAGSTDDTVFKVGTNLFPVVRNAAGFEPFRTDQMILYLDDLSDRSYLCKRTDDPNTPPGAGAQLSGVWRHRGGVFDSDVNRCMAERVA